MAKPARAWQRMLSGRRLDLLDPTPLDIEIEDIAHGLAFVARWNGQTRGDFAYSVAEHSLLVETLFARLYPTAFFTGEIMSPITYSGASCSSAVRRCAGVAVG